MQDDVSLIWSTGKYHDDQQEAHEQKGGTPVQQYFCRLLFHWMSKEENGIPRRALYHTRLSLRFLIVLREYEQEWYENQNLCAYCEIIIIFVNTCTENGKEVQGVSKKKVL